MRPRVHMDARDRTSYNTTKYGVSGRPVHGDWTALGRSIGSELHHRARGAERQDLRSKLSTVATGAKHPHESAYLIRDRVSGRPHLSLAHERDMRAAHAQGWEYSQDVRTVSKTVVMPRNGRDSGMRGDRIELTTWQVSSGCYPTVAHPVQDGRAVSIEYDGEVTHLPCSACTAVWSSDVWERRRGVCSRVRGKELRREKGRRYRQPGPSSHACVSLNVRARGARTAGHRCSAV
ncbi:hypothetical protein OH76DRAFT_624735 [Lentinus brumalis]|uniref:Uncharacterized protein n=1 Tax=Lentinus brumalis TaxID=2498619 RepID=A0A371CHB8_9APHY|nr:hypothetical protein OH76DRAFT_624735 [Polyporus brumalis]